MKLNWKAVIVGFVVAFVISLFSGLYLPKMGLIGPVIGGFIAVYMVEVSYTDGILYGGPANKYSWTYIHPFGRFLITKSN